MSDLPVLSPLPAADRPVPWSRGTLLALLAAATVLALLVVAGLSLAIYYTLQPQPGTAARSVNPEPSSPISTAAGTDPDPGRSAQDAIAARPMPTLALSDAQPGTVSDRDPGTITLPPSTVTGPDGVATGFPRTPAGALAQLAAIDETALQSATLDGVRAVITDWALPGGPTPSTWSAVKAMADFLNAAGLSGGGSPQLALVVTPLMGLIKGTVGVDFVVPCIDFQVDATLTATAQVADADCQRMTWHIDRWMIGPGPEPAIPPSAWPDTDTAISVGYQDLRRG